MKSIAVTADKLLIDDYEVADHIKCTLPDIKYKTVTLSGGGVMGDVEIPLQGIVESMSFSADLRSLNGENSAQVLAPGIKKAELRFLRSAYASDGSIIKAGTKIYLNLMAREIKGGDIERGKSPESNGSFSVLRYRWVEDGYELFLIDPINEIYNVNGRNYGESL